MRAPSRARRHTSRLRPHTRKSPRQPRSYTPLSDALSQPLTFADTELAEGIQRHSLAGLLRAAISRQRRSDGEPLPNVLCALLVWPLLKAKSLHCFCALALTKMDPGALMRSDPPGSGAEGFPFQGESGG
jgi:hypothetical protein